MKTIAIFTGYFLPHMGGVERYTYGLAKQLHASKNRIIIVTTQYDKNLPLLEETQYAKIYRLPTLKIFANRHPILKQNRTYRQIKKQIEQEGIDSIILNTRFWLTSLMGAKLAKKHHIPACLIEHGISHFTVHHKIIDKIGEWYEHRLTNKMKKLVDNFYGVSKECCYWLTHFKIKAKGVFYNAVDTTEYEMYHQEKQDKDVIDILFVGRLLKDKGILLLIEAFNNLKKKYSNLQLTIVGEGPLQKELEKKEEIRMLGRLEHAEVMKQYEQSDIVVNPSYSEGLPTTLLEAGLMKCTILATPVGGTKEIIEDGISGIFCNTTVDDIQDKLEMLIQHPELRKRLGEKVQETIQEKFSWKKVAKEVQKQISYQ